MTWCDRNKKTTSSSHYLLKAIWVKSWCWTVWSLKKDCFLPSPHASPKRPPTHVFFSNRFHFATSITKTSTRKNYPPRTATNRTEPPRNFTNIDLDWGEVHIGTPAKAWNLKMKPIWPGVIKLHILGESNNRHSFKHLHQQPTTIHFDWEVLAGN